MTTGLPQSGAGPATGRAPHAAAWGVAAVQVPATSANLGPGFDSLGLALGLVDDVTATVVDQPGVRVQVTGEGAGELASDHDHLVARALVSTLTSLGCPAPAGLLLRCTNRVPHGRGLGSSAAAVVAGVLLGQALAGGAPDGDDEASAADPAAALRLATEFEGHPDNAAAALLGGATIAWRQADGPHATRLEVHADVAPLVLLPVGRLATHHARAVLPMTVTHEDAAANVARSALLVHALRHEPALLHAATEDRLHQRQRRSAMPATLELVERLRDQGLAATVSGAGPAVLVLSTTSRRVPDAQKMARAVAVASGSSGWQLLSPELHHAPARARRLSAR